MVSCVLVCIILGKIIKFLFYISYLYKEFADYELSNGVTVRQIQMKLFEIFKYFKSICEENGLTY